LHRLFLCVVELPIPTHSHTAVIPQKVVQVGVLQELVVVGVVGVGVVGVVVVVVCGVVDEVEVEGSSGVDR